MVRVPGATLKGQSLEEALSSPKIPVAHQYPGAEVGTASQKSAIPAAAALSRASPALSKALPRDVHFHSWNCAWVLINVISARFSKNDCCLLFGFCSPLLEAYCVQDNCLHFRDAC